MCPTWWTAAGRHRRRGTVFAAEQRARLGGGPWRPPLPGRNPRALEQVRAAHYDIVDTARYLQRFYLHAYGEDMP